MNKTATVTAGQFFTLLFVSRASLTMLYSSSASEIYEHIGFLLPLIVFIPIGIMLSLPAVGWCASDRKVSLCSYAAENLGAFGKAVTLMYGGYFVISCFYSLLAFKDFLSEAFPAGAERILLIALLLCGCIFAAVRGIEAVSRMSLPVLLLILLSLVLMFAFLFQGYNAGTMSSGNVFSTASVSKGIVFLISRMNCIALLNVLSPHVNGNIKRGTIILFIAYSIIVCAAVILFSGSAGDYLSGQHFQSLKAIDGSGVLQRLTPLFILVAVCSFFCNTALYLIAASNSIRLVYKKLSIKKAAVVLAIAAFAVTVFIPDNAIKAILGSSYLFAALAVVFVFVLPVSLYLYRAYRTRKSRVKSADRRRKKARLFSLFLLIIPCLSVLSGCSSLQLNQRLIVQGLGVDKTGNSYKLTVIMLDTKDPEQENKSSVIYSQGETVEQALRQLEEQRGKRLLMSHCLFIMMNKQAASQKNNEVSLLTDEYNVNKTAELMVSSESAEKTLTSAVSELGYSTEEIASMTDSKAVWQNVKSCTLFDYISALNRNDEKLFLPYITINNSTRSLNASQTVISLDQGTAD